MLSVGPHSPVIPGQSWRGYTALQVTRKLGQGSGLVYCLDAGDAASAPSSATQWLDTSGNGHDFDLGTTGGAEGTDPTQNGTPGRMSSGEYFSSSDGARYFQYETTNPAAFGNMHKNSALWWWDCWHYAVLGSAYGILGTLAASLSNIGIRIQIAAGGVVSLIVGNGSGTAALNQTSGTAGINSVADARWNYIGVGVDEANSVVRMCINGQYGDVSASYSSPSASNATNVMEIGTRGGGNLPFPTGSRFGIARQFSRLLAGTEAVAFFNATRGRYSV